MLLISKFLDLPIMRAKEIIKKTIETYLDTFPSYIQKTRYFEKEHELQMQYRRRGTKIFSERLQSLYDNKLIELKKLGVLQELGVIEKYGGILQREQKSLVLQKNRKKDVI